MSLNSDNFNEKDGVTKIDRNDLEGVFGPPEPYPDVLEFLRESKYVVLIRQTNEGLVMYIPKGYFSRNKIHYEYDFKLHYYEDEGWGEFILCDDKLDRKIPLCVLRLFVGFLISTELASINYEQEYAIIQNKKGETLSPTFTDFIELLPSFKDEKYYKQENNIIELLREYRKLGGRFNAIIEEKAKNYGVLSGFKFLTDLLVLSNNKG